MVIQCESCQTVFNLDESLLKEEGTKVRCSRCRHILTAYPSASAPVDLKMEIPDVGKEFDPTPKEKMDEIFAEVERGAEKEKEVGADSGLESDLDVIYQDVFREVDGSDPDEKAAVSDEVEDIFQETSRGEAQLASRPAIVFPSMDTVGENGEADKDEHEPESAPPSKKKSSKLSMAVLIPLIFVILGAAGAVVVWKADLIPPSVLSLIKPSSEKKEPGDAGARLLQFGSVSGVFVDSEKSGPLFVIRGMVSNKYPESRRYIVIKGSILDNKGGVVIAKNAYAGNTFSEEELKTLPLEEIIKAADNRDGMARQNVDVASGATIPFMIVFAKLPDELSEFTVEAVSSSPGS